MRRASSYFFRIFFVYNFEYLKNEDDMDFEKLTFLNIYTSTGKKYMRKYQIQICHSNHFSFKITKVDQLVHIFYAKTH